MSIAEDNIIILIVLIFAGILVATILAMRNHGRNRDLAAMQTQVQDLVRLFGNPAIRGVAGERLLEHILSDILPRNMFSLQYRFPDGRIVDAVVHIAPFLIPVDAKFPLESVQAHLNEGKPEKCRAVLKKFSTDIAQKYLRPQDRTTPFVFMYLPSEQLYYALFMTTDTGLLKEITDLRVIPVGPNALFLYLYTVGGMFRDMRLSKTETLTMNMLSQLRQDSGECSSIVEKTSLHLRRLQNSVTELRQRIQNLESTLTRPRNRDE